MAKRDIIDYDKYGHCVHCHARIMNDKFVDNEWIKQWEPSAKRKEVLLDDGSLMGIMLCSDCYNKFDEKQFDKVMKSVVRGWDKEIDDIMENAKHLNWTEGKKKAFLEKYGKLKIVCDTKDKPRDVLDKMLAEHNKGR